MFSSLQSRITAWMFALAVICSLMVTTISGSLLFKSHRDSVRRQLEATAAVLLTLGISDYSELEDFSRLNTFIENALQMERVDKIVRIFDSSRRLIFTTVGLDFDVLPNQLDGEYKKPQFDELEGKKETYESLIMPYEAKKKKFYLQVAIHLPKYSDIFSRFLAQEVLILFALFIISLVLSHFLSSWLVRPVRDIAEYLRKLDPVKIDEAGSLKVARGGVFLDPIVKGINVLIVRTKDSVAKLRKMTRYVAHEMRTPLTILRGEAEMVMSNDNATAVDFRCVLKSSLEEIQRMSDIVTTVLKVGEDERIMESFSVETIDLRLWIGESKKEWEKTLGRPVEYEFASPGPSTVTLDPKLLFRLVDNLVRNVRDHTRPDTTCLLKLDREMGICSLYVMDNGPGVKSTLLDTLNHPKGMIEHGHVGLSLCQRIAEVLHLKLYFSNRPEGGFCVKISF